MGWYRGPAATPPAYTASVERARPQVVPGSAEQTAVRKGWGEVGIIVGKGTPWERLAEAVGK
jgi:hypothetical protein